MNRDKTERPIIFSTEMVKAILDGRKTMTRRMIKPQPKKTDFGIDDKRSYKMPFGIGITQRSLITETLNSYKAKCPFGKVGDRLWVRESWQPHYNRMETTYFETVYKADDIKPIYEKWRSSLFMPRWASRITLEITDIRVERLQEISEEDAKAEGCLLANNYEELAKTFFKQPYKEVFIDLWNSIHKKKYRWENNPWVWVITFKRLI